MVAGAAWMGLLVRVLQQLFLYILRGYSGVWRLQPGLEAHIHIAKVILGLQSYRTEALDLIWGNQVTPEPGWWLGRNGIYCALAKPSLAVSDWEKDLVEGQVGYFPDHLPVVNE